MGSNEAQNKQVKWPLVAHVGMYQSFGNYLGFYEHVVERLYADIAIGREPLDIIAPPLLFLMRHTMELGYKYALWELHEMNEEPFNANAYGNHQLNQLHAALRVQYDKAVLKYDLPDHEVQNFEEYYEKTAIGMSHFKFLDASSFAFRYPMDKSGRPNFASDQTVDMKATKLVFDDAMVLLRHTADVLSEYVDFHRWMESESRGYW